MKVFIFILGSCKIGKICKNAIWEQSGEGEGEVPFTDSSFGRPLGSLTNVIWSNCVRRDAINHSLLYTCLFVCFVNWCLHLFVSFLFVCLFVLLVWVFEFLLLFNLGQLCLARCNKLRSPVHLFVCLFVNGCLHLFVCFFVW